MSNILIDKLKEIKNEKIEKLIPENIAKDVTILGVTGTFEGGNMTDEEYAEALERATMLIGSEVDIDTYIEDGGTGWTSEHTDTLTVDADSLYLITITGNSTILTATVSGGTIISDVGWNDYWSAASATGGYIRTFLIKTTSTTLTFSPNGNIYAFGRKINVGISYNESEGGEE